MFSSMRHLICLNNICSNTGRVKNCLPKIVYKCFYRASAFNKKSDKEKDLTGSAASRYDVFIDEESPIIFDIDQEREKYYEVNDDVGRAEKKRKEFLNISPERGVTGVIEIDELTSILRRENAINMIVIKVPVESHYVDYMVIVSGRSSRHMKAMAEFIKRVYKYKTRSSTNVPIIEGINSKDWMAIDLGNIALHIMSESSRKNYNLESLWALSKEFDLLSRLENKTEETDYEDILINLSSSTNK